RCVPSRRRLLHRKPLRVQVFALRTSRVLREAPPRLGAEGRAAKSPPIAEFATNFNPRNGRARVGEMLANAAIKFCKLFRVEAELGLALVLVETLPQSHGDLGTLARRKLEEQTQCLGCHKLIVSHVDHVGKKALSWAERCCHSAAGAGVGGPLAPDRRIRPPATAVIPHSPDRRISNS